MSKKTLIAAGVITSILILSLAFMWRTAPDAAIKTGEAEVDVRFIAEETILQAETMKMYVDGSVDATKSAETILASTGKVSETIAALDSKKLEPIELEALVASYLAFNNFFNYYEDNLIAIDTALNNNAATTRATSKTTKLLYEFAQDSVQNLKVPKYSLSEEASTFIKSEAEKNESQQ